MSPIDPTSPTSPMDLSPLSPVEAAMILNLPTTPVIAPAIYLPRLLTSFQNSSSGLSSSRRASLQSQLCTPSPLSLGRTPSTWTGSGGSRTSGSYTEGLWTGSPMSAVQKDLQTQAQTPLWRGTNPFGTPVVVRKVPKLVRQNANEGLEGLEGEDYSLYDSNSDRDLDSEEEVLNSLPLRVNTQILGAAMRASPSRYSPTTERSTVNSSISPAKLQTHTKTTTTLPATSRSRSPIRKPKTKRKPLYNHRHLTHLTKPKSKSESTPPPPKLLVRDPPSPSTLTRQTDLASRISHLSRRLVPLVSVTTGLPHPEFPTNLLRYQLLTHDQLDALAVWYHQTGNAGRERWMYPCPFGVGKSWCGGDRGADESENRREGVEGEVDSIDLETKRRRWGRFIGLQGCESPVENEDGDGESIEKVEERMEKEWNEALRRAREAEKVREKIWRGRF